MLSVNSHGIQNRRNQVKHSLHEVENAIKPNQKLWKLLDTIVIAQQWCEKEVPGFPIPFSFIWCASMVNSDMGTTKAALPISAIVLNMCYGIHYVDKSIYLPFC